MAINRFAKWHLVSRPMLWIYRRQWVRANLSRLSLLVGFVVGALLALAIHLLRMSA